MSQLLFGFSNQRRQDGRGMQYAWKRLEMHTEFYKEILKGKDRFGDLDIHGRITLKYLNVL
jgi:hypothetical protein